MISDNRECPGALFVDTAAFMRVLSKMANMDVAPIRRMVLVLDVDAIPTLYVESYLDVERVDVDNLPTLDLTVIEQPVIVQATDKGVTVSPAQTEVTK